MRFHDFLLLYHECFFFFLNDPAPPESSPLPHPAPFPIFGPADRAAPPPSLAPAEFHPPDLVNYQAASWLDSIRGVYGNPLSQTSAPRPPAENEAASGSS